MKSKHAKGGMEKPGPRLTPTELRENRRHMDELLARYYSSQNDRSDSEKKRK